MPGDKGILVNRLRELYNDTVGKQARMEEESQTSFG